MTKKPIVIICITLIFARCAPYINQPLQPVKARIGAESDIYYQLKDLPKPKDKIVAAVYKFRDQTGQYKPSEVGASWSTAVTQGATSILQRSLEASGWFTTIEREGLSNLLNERKIIRSSRQSFSQQQNSEVETALPPLLFAGVLLEGGIISYDANMLTGGAGARYFGVGGSTEYRQDRVTVYLRAISTSNGRILKTVYTSRTILSQKVDFGVFRFVSFQRLLEAETGITHNEPAELAVREAIEKAVQSLVIEGVLDGLWQLKNPEDVNKPAILSYKQETMMHQQNDYLGRRINHFSRSKVRVGASFGAFLYAGDYPDPLFTSSYSINFGLQVSPRLTMGIEAAQGNFAVEGGFQQDVRLFKGFLSYRLSPITRLTPLLELSGGWITDQSRAIRFGQGMIAGGVGAEYLINPKIGLVGHLRHQYILSDTMDQIKQGKYNDFFYSASLGLNFYFGNQ